MKPELNSRAGLPSHAEARAIVEQARRLRADTLARLARAAWAAIAGSRAGAPTGSPAVRMPHARA